MSNQNKIESLKGLLNEAELRLKRAKDSPIFNYYQKKMPKESYKRKFFGHASYCQGIADDIDMLKILIGIEQDRLKTIQIEEFKINE